MLKNEFYFSNLVAASLQGKLSPQEQDELATWIKQSDTHQQFFDSFLNEQQLNNKLKTYAGSNKEAVWSKTLDKIKSYKSGATIKPIKKLHRLNYKLAAAAVLLIALSVASWFYATRNDLPSAYHNDVAAGKNSATLTLSNGRKIRLTDAVNGELFHEAGISITKTANGQVMYNFNAADQTNNDIPAAEVTYNVLSTTNGEQYQLILPDSTKVWLNAASSISFPSAKAFLKDRKLRLQGEAYFEVTKITGDQKQRIPFTVITDKQQIEVLGTHFNVNSYANAQAVTTTLLEGSVRVAPSIILNPGQQSVLQNNIMKITQADIEEAIAWKNGYFKFNENLESIMQKVARWYNVQVVYEMKPDPNLAFEGKISRSRNISAVLKIIEYTGKVHFKIEGRRITVMQ